MLAKAKDWASRLTANVEVVLAVLLEGLRPPSELPIWKWLEENFELDPATSDRGGPVVFDEFPASKFFFNHAANPRTRQLTVMVSHQSGKTENAIMLLVYSVLERPLPTMWVMAAADQCEDFGKDRLFPAFQNCKPVAAICPKERKFWTKRMLKLPTMTLHLRGSNSRAKLQSSPIGRLILDERREYKHGAVHTVRNRTTTFASSQEVSMGVAGRKNDELHTDWLEGSQTFIHFRCPKCGHSQPFRFGTKASVLFPEPRSCGGLVWPANDTTKPGGIWDYDEVEKQTRYQCENPECRAEFENSQKAALLATAHEFHRNPKALPEHVSMHWNTLMMPWARCDWGKIVVRFLKAVAAMKRGDLEPLFTVTTEDFGEPFERPETHKQKGDLIERIGTYKLGEYWTDPQNPGQLEHNTVFILTFDRQLMRIRYLVRQWRKNGQSRLVHFGWVASLEDLRAKQLELKVTSRATWGDDGGGGTSVFRQAALQYGWGILKGEAYSHYTSHHIEHGVEKPHRQGWRQTDLDPGIGTTREGRATMKAWLWSNPWFKDLLYFHFVRGLGPLWEIASDTPTDYFAELNANEWIEQDNVTGAKEGFEETGPDHAADCELMQLVVADIAGITRLPAQVIRKEGDEAE